MTGAANAGTPVEEIARRRVERFSPEKIMLFGSRARGEARDDSDVDLLVLFSKVEDPRRRAVELYSAPAGCGLSKDIVVSTTERFELCKYVVNTVYWPAAREGRVLYDRAA